LFYRSISVTRSRSSSSLARASSLAFEAFSDRSSLNSLVFSLTSSARYLATASL